MAIWVAVIIVSLVGKPPHTCLTPLHRISASERLSSRLGFCALSTFNLDGCIGLRAHPPAASGNDYQKERQFKKINSQKDSIEVPAVRSGKQIVLKNTDVLVGDVLLLNTGDKVTQLSQLMRL